MKILIVEDDRRTANYLKKGLTEEGFTTDLAHGGDDGLRAALDHEFSLVILDVNLPQKSGWDVLRDLRAAGKQTPVLFLTAVDGVPERVKGLGLGADDYLVKPFAFTELIARIKTILRRGPQRNPETLSIGGLELDLMRRRAQRDGSPVNLSPKEFALLWLLASHQNEVLSRTAIEEQVWDMNFEGDSNVVDVAVRRLRNKVDDPHTNKLIHTVRGVGYVLKVEQ